MMKIFTKGKNYSLQKIVAICDKNGLAIVDCLKDENIISIERWNDGDGEDCIFEFSRVDEDVFKLSWLETRINLIPEKFK